MEKYKGWTIKVSASPYGFFSSGRGGKVVRRYSAYKSYNSMFGPSVHAKSLTELKKYINQWEKEDKESIFHKIDFSF